MNKLLLIIIAVVTSSCSYNKKSTGTTYIKEAVKVIEQLEINHKKIDQDIQDIVKIKYEARKKVAEKIKNIEDLQKKNKLNLETARSSLNKQLK